MKSSSVDFAIETANQIGKILITRQQTIAVAESVTAGHLQTSLSLADKAMEFFQGGITAYNIGQKTRHLNIDPIHAISNDCVSEKIASEMAKNVTTLFNSDWGIGITGYASPVPEKNIEELFACFAICFHSKIITSQTIKAAKDTPLAVRLFYNKQILQELLIQLKTAT
ncbi:MAG TPA: nicotinamide-nucleotide amidohydrolase family protein [Chitinophagaceae bacterium]|nr:nicotinamide-nucleotide amidohydrolase family protein [Chitinophagaceae bacterium]